MASKKYSFLYTKQAAQDFDSLPKVIQKQISQKLLFLQDNEVVFEHSLKLTGAEDKYRIRSGDYRIIFKPDKDGVLVILLILRIAHRKDVYR